MHSREPKLVPIFIARHSQQQPTARTWVICRVEQSAISDSPPRRGADRRTRRSSDPRTPYIPPRTFSMQPRPALWRPHDVLHSDRHPSRCLRQEPFPLHTWQNTTHTADSCPSGPCSQLNWTPVSRSILLRLGNGLDCPSMSNPPGMSPVQNTCELRGTKRRRTLPPDPFLITVMDCAATQARAATDFTG
jgi:hypothetical protein